MMAQLYYTHKVPSGGSLKKAAKKRQKRKSSPLPPFPAGNSEPDAGPDSVLEKANILRNGNVFDLNSKLCGPSISDSSSLEYATPEEEEDYSISSEDNHTLEIGSDADLNLEIEGDEESNRYFGKKKGSNAKCYNCGLQGHISRDCSADASEISCSMCIVHGHSRQQCPNQICFNCKLLGHQSKDCPSQRRRFTSERDICTLCDNPGHTSKFCSASSWRNYIYNRSHANASLSAHLKSADLDRCFRSLNSYCFCCAKKGHFGDECKRNTFRKLEDRWSAFHQYSEIYLKNCLLEKTHIAKRPKHHSKSDAR